MLSIMYIFDPLAQGRKGRDEGNEGMRKGRKGSTQINYNRKSKSIKPKEKNLGDNLGMLNPRSTNKENFLGLKVMGLTTRSICIQ